MPRRVGRPADDMHRRLARLLRSLTDHPIVGVRRDELMAAMGLDPENASDVRKFRRDLAALKDAGWQIDSIDRGANECHYLLRVVDARIRATFTDAERAQLLRAAERAHLGQLYDDLDPARSERTAGFGPPGLGAAQHAISHRCLVRFVYRARARLVDPYDVFYAGDAWYLRGHEDDSDLAFKTYRLDRASQWLTEAPGTAGPIPELPPPTRDPMRNKEGEPFDAVVAVSREDLPEAIDLLGVNGCRELAGGREGAVLLEVRVTHRSAFLGRLFEMDTRVRLVAPDHIRERARDVLLAAVKAVS